MSAVAEAPGQPSLRRMRHFAIRPDRDLGQNFLIDSNILGVIDGGPPQGVEGDDDHQARHDLLRKIGYKL